MVRATLMQIDAWYNEAANQVGDRPSLLSKLALLELCGWIEGEFDQLVLAAQTGRLNDDAWCGKHVIDKTSGFTFDHLRTMLAKLFGELYARRIEAEMERMHPGELERFTRLLKDLYKVRCSFAHADYVTNVKQQQVFNAPSWSLGQLAAVTDLSSKLQQALLVALADV